jgi:glycerol kinase
VQGTALGAALMAGVGSGLWSDVADISQFWRPGSVFEPRWDAGRRDGEYDLWRSRVALARPRAEALIR